MKECPKGKLVQALVNQDSSAFSFKGDFRVAIVLCSLSCYLKLGTVALNINL